MFDVWYWMLVDVWKLMFLYCVYCLIFVFCVLFCMFTFFCLMLNIHRLIFIVFDSTISWFCLLDFLFFNVLVLLCKICPLIHNWECSQTHPKDMNIQQTATTTWQHFVNFFWCVINTTNHFKPSCFETKNTVWERCIFLYATDRFVKKQKYMSIFEPFYGDFSRPLHFKLESGCANFWYVLKTCRFVWVSLLGRPNIGDVWHRRFINFLKMILFPHFFLHKIGWNWWTA